MAVDTALLITLLACETGFSTVLPSFHIDRAFV